MARKLIVEFTKMNGAGNDFVVVDNRFFNFSDEELSALAQRWCPRRVGIGADGVLALSAPSSGDHHFRMRYVNADGSIASMCGNGARCLARYARRAGIDHERLRFETDAGTFEALAPAEESDPVRLFVPPPEAYRPDVALAGLGANEQWDYLWTGTHHAVAFVDDVEAAPVSQLGPAVRHHETFQPEGTNVNFVQVAGDEDVRVRTFEKGVEAETLACGTGALASALVSRLRGRVHADAVRVHMPGGTLTVGAQRRGESFDDVYLEGPAQTVYRGTLELDVSTLSKKA